MANALPEHNGVGMSQVVEPYLLYSRLPADAPECVRHCARREWASVHISEDQIVTGHGSPKGFTQGFSFGVMLL